MDRTRRKICILTSAHSAFDVRVYHKEARTLADAGYAVTLVAPHKENDRIAGVRIRALPPPSNRWERLSLVLGRIWRVALDERADVYHLHDPDLVPVGFLLKMLGKKVVYDVHEDLKEDILTKPYVPQAVRYPLAWFSNAVEKLLAQRFDAIVTATDAIAQEFARCPVVAVLKNYPRLSEFSLVAEKVTKHDGFRCVYTGGLTEVRGISELVRAMSALNELEGVRLVLCGTFESQEFERALRSEDGFRKTEFRGWVDYRQMPNLLSGMDAGLVCLLPIPQFVVSLPIKLFEYMAVGLPVVASNFPLWREIIERAQCGICVDPGDPVQIAFAIRYLYEHPDEARHMGERGYRAVQERFNWEEEGKKLLSLYKDLLPGGCN